MEGPHCGVAFVVAFIGIFASFIIAAIIDAVFCLGNMDDDDNFGCACAVFVMGHVIFMYVIWQKGESYRQFFAGLYVNLLLGTVMTTSAMDDTAGAPWFCRQVIWAGVVCGLLGSLGYTVMMCGLCREERVRNPQPYADFQNDYYAGQNPAPVNDPYQMYPGPQH